MTLLLIEGFDHEGASLLTAKGWNNNPSSITAGQYDGQAARLLNSATQRRKALPSTYATLFGGFAFRTDSTPTATADIYIALSTGGTVNAFRIGLNTSRQIVVRNSGGTVIATGTTALVLNTWYFIEFKAFINGASGTCEIHLNGASGEITTTTGNFGSVNLDQVAFIGYTIGGTTNVDFDNIYCLDTTGSDNNTFLGSVRVETIFPTADGAHSQWTPSSGSAHFSLVNETTPDGDTTYVSDSTPNDLDTYAFGDIDGGATVYGVQTNLYARKDDAGTRQIAPVVRQAGTDNAGTTVTVTNTYVFYSQLYDKDPSSAAWTASNVNNDEFGVKEIA